MSTAPTSKPNSVKSQAEPTKGTRAWGFKTRRYEWLGPVAVRIDALEGILASLSNPRRLEQAFDQLGIEAAMRAVINKHVRRRPR